MQHSFSSRFNMNRHLANKHWEMAGRGVTHRTHGAHEYMGAPGETGAPSAPRTLTEMSQPEAQTNHELMSSPSNTIQDTQPDFVFKHPFTCMISGPTSSGKTYFVTQLLERAKENISPTPTENYLALQEMATVIRPHQTKRISQSRVHQGDSI